MTGPKVSDCHSDQCGLAESLCMTGVAVTVLIILLFLRPGKRSLGSPVSVIEVQAASSSL